MKQLKEVKISPGCISCGTCEVVCPKIFYIKDVSHVRENIDLKQHEDCIKEAVQMCPVNAIEVTYE